MTRAAPPLLLSAVCWTALCAVEIRAWVQGNKAVLPMSRGAWKQLLIEDSRQLQSI